MDGKRKKSAHEEERLDISLNLLQASSLLVICENYQELSKVNLSALHKKLSEEELIIEREKIRNTIEIMTNIQKDNKWLKEQAQVIILELNPEI
jgi:hypothetical protein